MFSCEFCEICKNTFLAEQLRTTASDYSRINSSEGSTETNVLKLSLMKKYGSPLWEINLLIASINVSVAKLVTNSGCVHCVVVQVNTPI